MKNYSDGHLRNVFVEVLFYSWSRGYWHRCADSQPFITAAAYRAAVIQTGEDRSPDDILSRIIGNQLVTTSSCSVSYRPASRNPLNEWLLNTQWLWQVLDLNGCQLRTNGTKTTVFWNWVRRVTFCAKGIVPVAKTQGTHNKNTMGRQSTERSKV